MLTYNIFDDVLQLRNLVDNFLNEAPAQYRRREYPYVKLYENGDALEVKAILPGVASADLDIKLVDNSLLIEGEKKDDTTGDPYIRRERDFGRFSKAVKLPFRVKGDAIRAELKNGILTIRLEKSEEAKPKKIAIN